MKGKNGIISVVMIGSFVAMLFSERVIRENFNEAIKRFMGSSSHERGLESEQQKLFS